MAKKATREGLKTFCGTPQYFAPEVLDRKEGLSLSGGKNSNNRYGFKADMWSLGVVLYIILCGAFPFDEENLYDQLREANYSVSGPEWRDVSSHAKHFVRSLMALNPADRLDVTQALEHPWMKMKATGGASRRQGKYAGSDSSSQSQTIPRSRNKPDQEVRNEIQNNKGNNNSRGACRSKTFVPVFWSNRPAFSATVTGEILASRSNTTLSGPSSWTSNKKQEGSPKLSDNADPACSSKEEATDNTEATTMRAWYKPIEQCADGVKHDEIADFSSTDDEGKVNEKCANGQQANQNRSGKGKRKKRKRTNSITTYPLSEPNHVPCGTAPSLLERVKAGGNSTRPKQSKQNPTRTSTELLFRNATSSNKDGSARKSNRDAHPVQNTPIDLTGCATPPPAKLSHKSSKRIKTTASKKESLRVPIKTLPDMFRLSKAKQERQNEASSAQK